MDPGAHIFIVTPETYVVHRDYQFCATGKSASKNEVEKSRLPESVEQFKLPAVQRKLHSFVADLWNVRQGDLVFFYVTNQGFKGVYLADSEPFYDPTQVDCVGPERPFRLFIKPVRLYDEPVPEEVVFLSSELQKTFWVWYFAKMRNRGRGCHAIDPGGRDKLIELLIKRNYGKEKHPAARRYPTRSPFFIKSLHLEHKDNASNIATEDTLRASILKAIRDQDSHIAPVVGPLDRLEWYANNVPYHVSGKNIDLLLFHKSDVFSRDFPIQARVQYSIIELKKDSAGIEELNQLLRYCEWAGGQLAEGDLYTVQPILLAKSFKQELLDFVPKLRVGFKPISLLRFSLDDGVLTYSPEQTKEESPVVDGPKPIPARTPQRRVDRRAAKVD